MSAPTSCLFAALSLIAACTSSGDGVTVDAARQQPHAEVGATQVHVLPGYAGALRHLPALRGDLVQAAGELDHPREGGYGTLTVARAERFDTFLDALHQTLAQTIADGRAGDWCAVRTLADAAGYRLSRYRDEASGRWFLFGEDQTQFGHAYVFIDPYPKRDLVIEVPHEPFDQGTAVQGARTFLALGARALLINKEHRCSDPDPTPCDGTTQACDGAFRESDVAHHPANTFHRLHVWYSEHDPDTRFVQLHGFTGAEGDRVEIADGTRNDVDFSSVSVSFANHLRARVPDPDAVHACQDEAGNPPTGLCATTNTQGRHTNAPTQVACTDSTTSSSGRFLHIEQDAVLRGADAIDGWSWAQVSDALRDTWPACDLSGQGDDCAPGEPQADFADCACDQICW